MEDFTYYDFTGCERRKRMNANQFAVNHSKNNKSVTFNQEVSSIVLKRDLMFLRVRVDNATGDIHLIFTKDTGCKLTTTGKTAKNVIAINKSLSDFLVEKLHLHDGSGRDLITMSDNLANSKDFLTYKILSNV